MAIKNKYFIPLLVFNLLIFQNQMISQLTVDEIISKHLEVSGSANIPLELRGFRIEGEMIQNLLHSPLKISGIMPDKLRLDMTYENLDYVKISNGSISWDFNPKIDSLSSNANNKAEARDFIDHLTGGLYKYSSGLIKARLLGTVSIDDVEIYKVEIWIDNYVKIYYIDKLSYLILRIDDDVKENKGTYYNDYRKVGKYYIPFSLSGFEAGMPAITMIFKSVVINPDLKEELFYKPVLKK